ncbi:MAG TPA: hypothetical protein VF758_03325 [Candidatus Acidoferrum sp.]
MILPVVSRFSPRLAHLSLLAIVFSLPGSTPAQSAAPAEPAVVLRDILFAACAEKPEDFARSLTARNAEAFSHMTPAARTALLKRFVLLDKPGSPRAEADASGQLTVFCAAPEVTTRMRIGAPEVRDNLAYLPLVLSDAADAEASSARRITMGLVREGGQWRLLSLGLLLLDLPSLGEEWDQAEIKSNEQSALAHLREIAEAIEKYRITYTRLPEALAALGPASGGAPKAEKAGLLAEDLADGRKDGYAFRYVVVGANTSGAPAIYELAAIPVEYGRTGSQSFFRDSAGTFHAADHHGAVGSAADAKIE